MRGRVTKLLVNNVLECTDAREREQEMRGLMRQLERRYTALQVVPVIKKFGSQTVRYQVFSSYHDYSCLVQ